MGRLTGTERAEQTNSNRRRQASNRRYASRYAVRYCGLHLNAITRAVSGYRILITFRAFTVFLVYAVGGDVGCLCAATLELISARTSAWASRCWNSIPCRWPFSRRHRAVRGRKPFLRSNKLPAVVTTDTVPLNLAIFCGEMLHSGTYYGTSTGRW